MKILSLHCDYIKFRPLKKALREPEQLAKEDEKGKEASECLVILASVEKSDGQNPSGIVGNLVANIKDISSQVNCKKIVLYPYAHLAADLALPSEAMKILQLSETELKKQKFEVVRAPFGYYKEFELKCKGHPLSELSRVISADGKVKIEKSGALKPEEKYDYKQLLSQIQKSKLDTSKIKDNDHRILGQRMDLFSFNDVAPGMVFWHNNGLIIYNELVKYLREEHLKAGYQEISTPFILDKKLWQISGHWEKYRENIFLTKYEGRDFAVKPMNCPGGILIYKSKPRSYRELPMRVAELGIVHRQELSGVLAGLFRVIKITQDDAHIYCREEQLENEIIGVIELIDRVYKKFGFEYHVELSTRPEKRIGEDKLWDKAEKVLESVLKKCKAKFKTNKGDGAFYGPKIDFHIKDSLGRTWQCATIQLDFAMPERFELGYIGEDNKMRRPVMIHRTVYGSLERFIGILLEHLNGNLPVWLAPVQARVISFTTKNIPYAQKIKEKFMSEGVRVDSDFEPERIEAKVRDAEIQKIPYIIVIGDKEQQKGTLAVRTHGVKSVKFDVKLNEFIDELKGRIKERK